MYVVAMDGHLKHPPELYRAHHDAVTFVAMHHDAATPRRDAAWKGAAYWPNRPGVVICPLGRSHRAGEALPPKRRTLATWRRLRQHSKPPTCRQTYSPKCHAHVAGPWHALVMPDSAEPASNYGTSPQIRRDQVRAAVPAGVLTVGRRDCAHGGQVLPMGFAPGIARAC
jgi:hypothetical protein